MRKTHVDMRPFLHRFFASRFLNANPLLYKRILVSVYQMHCSIVGMFGAIKDYVPRLFCDIVSVVVERLMFLFIRYMLTLAGNSFDALLVQDPVSVPDGIEKWAFLSHNTMLLIAFHYVVRFWRFAFSRSRVVRYLVAAVSVFCRWHVVRYLVSISSRWLKLDFIAWILLGCPAMQININPLTLTGDSFHGFVVQDLVHPIALHYTDCFLGFVVVFCRSLYNMRK